MGNLGWINTEGYAFDCMLRMERFQIRLMLENPDMVVLGCRDFDLPYVPPRSVAGNKLTAKAFRIFFGIRSVMPPGVSAITFMNRSGQRTAASIRYTAPIVTPSACVFLTPSASRHFTITFAISSIE